MASQANSTDRAVCSAVVRRFDGLSSAARPVRGESAFPSGSVLSGAARGAFARSGSVFGGNRRGFRGVFRPAGAEVRDGAPRGSAGEFAGGAGDCPASVGTACRKIYATAGKRLQFSEGWGKRKQQVDSLPRRSRRC